MESLEDGELAEIANEDVATCSHCCNKALKKTKESQNSIISKNEENTLCVFPCGHSLCKTCCNVIVRSALQAQKMPVHCVKSTCSAQIQPADLKSVMSSHILSRFDELLTHHLGVKSLILPPPKKVIVIDSPKNPKNHTATVVTPIVSYQMREMINLEKKMESFNSFNLDIPKVISKKQKLRHHTDLLHPEELVICKVNNMKLHKDRKVGFHKCSEGLIGLEEMMEEVNSGTRSIPQKLQEFISRLDCIYCMKHFPSLTALDSHMHNTSKHRLFACCGEPFKNFESMKMHRHSQPWLKKVVVESKE